MRERCVGVVQASRLKHEQTPVESEDHEYDYVIAIVLARIEDELQSLTLDEKKEQ